MPEPSSHDSPPVQENNFWLHVEARARQFGLFIMLLVVLAAISGLFSQGYFSHAERASGDGKVTLEYERFGRLLSDMEMKIVAKPGGARTTIVLGGEFMDKFEIQTLSPQPEKMINQGNALVLIYPHPDATVWLSLIPLTAGNSHNWIAVNGGQPLPFRQFIYP